MGLIQQTAKNTNNPNISILSKSEFFNDDEIQTEIPLLNIALSGSLNGGMTRGISMFCGESKTFKTGFLIQMAKSHQNKYKKKSVCLFFDSEFSNVKYFSMQGVNTDQILHIPVRTVEELKIEASKLLDSIPFDTDEHFIILIDSIGALASVKETQDAIEGKNTVDMSRAKAVASLFRTITTKVNFLNIPLSIINSHYDTLEMFSKKVVSGGKRIYLSCDDVFFINRATDKDGKVITGHKFTITADKSRTIKEGSKFPINISYDKGIDKNSGLFELAVEAGIVIQSGAWYQTITNGVKNDKKQRRSEITTQEFYNNLLKNKEFNEFIKNKYQLN